MFSKSSFYRLTSVLTLGLLLGSTPKAFADTTAPTTETRQPSEHNDGAEGSRSPIATDGDLILGSFILIGGAALVSRMNNKTKRHLVEQFDKMGVRRDGDWSWYPGVYEGGLKGHPHRMRVALCIMPNDLVVVNLSEGSAQLNFRVRLRDVGAVGTTHPWILKEVGSSLFLKGDDKDESLELRLDPLWSNGAPQSQDTILRAILAAAERSRLSKELVHVETVAKLLGSSSYSSASV